MSANHDITSHTGSRDQGTPVAAKSFSFATQRRKNGLAQGVGGIAMLTVGAFLLSQIRATPALVVQLAILGSACSIAGLGLITSAIRDLVGRLVIDDGGISIRPHFTGYSIRWDELNRWEVRFDSGRYPEADNILFWTTDAPCPLFIPNGWLTDQDRLEIHRMLKTQAPDKEVTAGRRVR